MAIQYQLSGNTKSRRRRRARPEVVADILKLALKRRGLDQDLARYDFFRYWPEIVGPEIARRAQPECLRGKTLVVRVSDSMWAQELAFQKEVILKRVKKYVGDKLQLNDLNFYVDQRGFKPR